MQESVRAIGKMKVVVFLPLLQCAAIVVFLVPWVIYSVYTASLGDVSANNLMVHRLDTYPTRAKGEPHGQCPHLTDCSCCDLHE